MATKQYDSVLSVTSGDRGMSTTNSTKGVNGMTKYRLATAALVALVALAFSSTAFAHAATPQSLKDNPTPSCPSGYHFNGTTGKCDKDAPSVPQGCYTDTNGVQYCNQTATDSADESDLKVEKLSITSNGVLQLRMFAPHGSSAPKKGCQWFPYGTNSYMNASGGYTKIPWPHRTYACRDKSSPSGWRKRGPVDCWNYFWPPYMKPPGIYYGKYKLVENFTFQAKMTLKLTLHGNVSAEAHCTVGDAANGASAKANVTGVDIESITVTGTGSGSSWVEAVGKAHQAALSSTEALNLQAQVQARASLKMRANASVSCHASPPGPTPQVCQYGGTYPNCNQPPATPVCQYGGTYPNCNQPPTPVTLVLSNLTAPQNGPNGVYADGGRYPNICVTVQGKSGDTIKLTFGATLGSFEQSIFTITSTGVDRFCQAVYKSPLDSGAYGKTETISVSGTDIPANVNSTGLNNGPNPTASFVLTAPPTRP